MHTISILSAAPRLASVCPTTIAVPAVAEPSVAAWGKLSRSAAEFASAAAGRASAQAALAGLAASADLGRSVRDRGESGFGAARPMHAYDRQTPLIRNGMVRGPLPWRNPVAT